RLALSGLHFGDPPEMQCHATHELHVEVTLPEHPPGYFTHDGVGLDQQIVKCLPLLQALPELHRLVRQLGIAEGLHFGLQRGDGFDELEQSSDLLTLACLENLGEHAHEEPILPVPWVSPASLWQVDCVRLTWSLTPHSPAARLTCRPRRSVGVTAHGPNGACMARIASSPPAPEDRGLAGQGLPLSRTMLSNHKLPYVGRFACDWPRLATTDPHAARAKCRCPRPLLRPTAEKARKGRRRPVPDGPDRTALSSRLDGFASPRPNSPRRRRRRFRPGAGSRRKDPYWRWGAGPPATPSWPSPWPRESGSRRRGRTSRS